jgi:hypothetical protein
MVSAPAVSGGMLMFLQIQFRNLKKLPFSIVREVMAKFGIIDF